MAQAWDTLFWFAVLVGMSGQLNSMGVIKLFADGISGRLAAWNLGWQAVFAILNVAYFLLHYIFASQTAHVSALYAAFLGMMLSAGAPLWTGLLMLLAGCTWWPPPILGLAGPGPTNKSPALRLASAPLCLSPVHGLRVQSAHLQASQLLGWVLC